VARRAGLNKGILSKVECGKQPLARYAARLAAVLGEKVLELERPGQLRLALDWTQAKRRFDLDVFAKEWLRERAQVSLDGEVIEVWQLGESFVFTPADLVAPAVPA
jgi:transcriptional regulator with XRE-family HTH domain